MATRIRKHHQDEIREKIRVSNLIARVQKYAEGGLSDGDISPNRLNAIKLLLNKTLHDLSAVTIANEEGEEFKITTITRTIVKPGDTNT